MPKATPIETLVTEEGGPPSVRGDFRALPPDIWALGLGSLLMDTSSELVHSLLPIFMASVLGAGTVTIGLVEGVAEATASVTKALSGTLSDRLGKRKVLVVSGYGLSALTKLVFPLAPSVGWVFAARFMDRMGKGIRGAPRDALMADITPPELRGAAYGLRQALDSVGAFLGPLLAVILMAQWGGDITAVFWVAVIPAVMAVAVLMVAVREPEQPRDRLDRRGRFTMEEVTRLPSDYWLVVLIGAVFTLSRFSEAFLVLRASSVGLAAGYVPTVMIVMNVVYAGAAYPAGVGADRFGRRTLLVTGLGALVLADLVLAAATTPAWVFLGAACWGLHMGLTQGLLSKLVADTAPAALRGTAFGIFNLVSGGTLLMASGIAGALWSAFGPPATFLAGALFAALAAFGLTDVPRKISQRVGEISRGAGRSRGRRRTPR